MINQKERDCSAPAAWYASHMNEKGPEMSRREFLKGAGAAAAAMALPGEAQADQLAEVLDKSNTLEDAARKFIQGVEHVFKRNPKLVPEKIIEGSKEDNELRRLTTDFLDAYAMLEYQIAPDGRTSAMDALGLDFAAQEGKKGKFDIRVFEYLSQQMLPNVIMDHDERERLKSTPRGSHEGRGA